VADSPDTAENLQRNLELDGYAVTLATRASQALAPASSGAPDLVGAGRGAPGPRRLPCAPGAARALRADGAAGRGGAPGV